MEWIWFINFNAVEVSSRNDGCKTVWYIGKITVTRLIHQTTSCLGSF